MKQPKLYKLYFEYRHEVQPKDAVFACICRDEQVEKIVKYYEELWWEIVERQLDQTLNEYTVEELTNDPILQGWESFEAAPLLEDLETGERFYYWEEGVDGYKLEPLMDKTAMNKELKTVVDHLKDNDNIQTGEDGGSLLSTLAEYLVPVTHQPLGLFRHPSYDPINKEYSLKGTLCRLTLIIYEWDEYKFVVIESTEEDVSPGGTCYSGTVELYYE